MTRLYGLLSREPVRVYVGGLLAALVVVLLAYGLVSGEQATAWLALGTALLTVPVVEGTRQRVTPSAPLRRPRHARTRRDVT